MREHSYIVCQMVSFLWPDQFKSVRQIEPVTSIPSGDFERALKTKDYTRFIKNEWLSLSLK